MIVEREDNSALYFIVGGLLVTAVAFAIFYFKNDEATNATVAETPTISRTEPAAGNTNSTSLSVDNNGVKATTTTQQ